MGHFKRYFIWMKASFDLIKLNGLACVASPSKKCFDQLKSIVCASIDRSMVESRRQENKQNWISSVKSFRNWNQIWRRAGGGGGHSVVRWVPKIFNISKKIGNCFNVFSANLKMMSWSNFRVKLIFPYLISRVETERSPGNLIQKITIRNMATIMYSITMGA